MKIRHNKKRNTAFLYESLIREATLCILKKQSQRKDKVLTILKENFQRNRLLHRDLDCYRSLYPYQGLSGLTAARVLKETRGLRATMDKQQLFKEQTQLIDRINTELGASVFSNFVPNYKTLATISQLFGDKGKPKDKILLENKLIDDMSGPPPQKQQGGTMDATVYRIFVEKFNEKYDNQLLPEQKELLNYYVSSFADNAVSLKIFLNEELQRLKEHLRHAILSEDIKDDTQMIKNTEKVLDRLESYKTPNLHEDMLLTVLRTQQLVKEIAQDGD
jgi:hypothetical protein